MAGFCGRGLCQGFVAGVCVRGVWQGCVAEVYGRGGVWQRSAFQSHLFVRATFTPSHQRLMDKFTSNL